MKSPFVAVAFGALLVTPALADKPGSDWVSMDQVLGKLKAGGYGPVSKIEADDGMWKALADKDGKGFKIRLDAKSGEIIRSRAQKNEDDDED